MSSLAPRRHSPIASVSPTPGFISPPAEIVDAVRRLVAEVRISGAARALDVGREPVCRLLGGLPIRRGTLALVERALARRESRPSR